MIGTASKVRVAVVGASGRTGSLILSVLSEFPELELGAALVSRSSRVLGISTGIGSILFSSDIQAGIESSDMVIDFSTPTNSVLVAQCAAKLCKPLLVATTGLSAAQRKEIESAASAIPVTIASNTSIGIFVLNDLAARAQALLGGTFDVEILEIHHRHKKDAPSGTALTLATTLTEQGAKSAVMGRAAISAPRNEAEIGVESLRGGDVAGDHTVYFLGRGERIELSHRVSDRAVFARGALRLAQKLYRMKPGHYSVSDLMTGVSC